MAKQKLGRGLDAIFGEDLMNAIEDIQHDESSVRNEIRISEIHVNPYQPRVQFDKDKLEELAQSIRENGVFTPVLVRKSLNGYELIAGERRLRASKLAEKETIPAIVVEMADDTMMQVTLLENIQRENLNAIEEANGYFTLMNNLGYTQEQLANKMGKSRAYIANLLRLRKLPMEVQDMVAENKLSGSHVRTLLTLDDEEEIIAWAHRTIKENLSVHQLEELLKKPVVVKKPAKEKDIFVRNLEETLTGKLQTKVEVKKHKLVIDFTDNDDLNRILELLNCLEEGE